MHNTAQNSSDDLHSYLQTTVIAQMLKEDEDEGRGAWHRRRRSQDFVWVSALFFSKKLTTFFSRPDLPKMDSCSTSVVHSLPGDALTTLPCKFGPENFFFALKGAYAPSALSGYGGTHGLHNTWIIRCQIYSKVN